ncbi:hypothetical protein (nucleomorph) [Guillardia theta]|uniref:Transmembrane protein n=1 Tax=Guillardia theta TaxID=55529 RepID=Q98RM6_GUITH|nr:hypothetical protein GTHECHR1129 [Guillardia theta]AAK39922.1 hypothetical protein [Guillardia theta]
MNTLLHQKNFYLKTKLLKFNHLTNGYCYIQSKIMKIPKKITSILILVLLITIKIFFIYFRYNKFFINFRKKVLQKCILNDKYCSKVIFIHKVEIMKMLVEKEIKIFTHKKNSFKSILNCIFKFI